MTRWQRLERWVADFRWAMNAMRARRWRRDRCTFSQRQRFDLVLRPRLPEPGMVIDYPDALYHIKVEDVGRAMSASRMVPP